MLNRAKLILAGVMMFGTVGLAQAHPTVVVGVGPVRVWGGGVVVRPAHPWVNWYPSHPAYVYEYSAPAYGGAWSVTITDGFGRSATYRESGSTVYEAESYAKQAFRRQFAEYGELRVAGATQIAP